jgi:hypothetical protein
VVAHNYAGTSANVPNEMSHNLTKYSYIHTALNRLVRLPALLLHSLAAALIAAAVLTACAHFVDWSALCVNGMQRTLNDQVGYISVARNILESGTLQSNIQYPSVLTQLTSRNSLYMPGYYWALAGVYDMVGYSVAHSFIPALFAFAVSSILVVIIAFRRYGLFAAYLSCLFFVFFPVNVIYAFTAMPELPLTASVLLAFTAFLFAPRRWRPLTGAAALILPMLFRETGVIVGILMILVISQEPRNRARSIAVFLAAAVLAGTLLWTSPVSAGRPSLVRANIFSGSFDAIYTNAFAFQAFRPSLSDWISAIGMKVKGNLHALYASGFGAGRPTLLEYFSFLAIISGIPLGVILWRKKRDYLMLGISLMISAILLLILGAYAVWSFRGLRMLLFAEPFVAILFAVVIRDLWRTSQPAKWIVGLLVVIVPLGGVWWVSETLKSEKTINHQAALDTAFLESIGHESVGLLVSPDWLSLDYVEKHYPVRWAFLPSNADTLTLLNERYPIATVIVPVADMAKGRTRLRESDFRSIGLSAVGQVSYRDQEFWIFKRSPAAGLSGRRERPEAFVDAKIPR